MSSQNEKVALITGGSRGIGAEIAKRLASDGTNVVITYAASTESAHQVVSEAQRKGVQAEAIRADASQEQEVKGLVNRVVQQYGRLDILVNNVGLFPYGPLEEISQEEYDRVFATNVKSYFITTQEAATVMKPGSSIINIGTAFVSRVPFPGMSLYTATKYAITGFTKAWARDLGAKGIKVNVVHPGPINTDMNPSDGPMAETQAGLTALGKYGEASDVANLVSFLAGPESGNITGTSVHSDGGFTI